MDVDISSDNGNADEGDAKYEWKMRVEVDDQLKGSNPAVPLQTLPSQNPVLRNLLGFMRDGRKPTYPSAEDSQ
jgi:hypothetical protein